MSINATDNLFVCLLAVGAFACAGACACACACAWTKTNFSFIDG